MTCQSGINCGRMKDARDQTFHHQPAAIAVLASSDVGLAQEGMNPRAGSRLLIRVVPSRNSTTRSNISAPSKPCCGICRPSSSTVSDAQRLTTWESGTKTSLPIRRRQRRNSKRSLLTAAHLTSRHSPTCKKAAAPALRCGTLRVRKMEPLLPLKLAMALAWKEYRAAKADLMTRMSNGCAYGDSWRLKQLRLNSAIDTLGRLPRANFSEK